jgi:DNA-binding CsgD family transcriptional regulator
LRSKPSIAYDFDAEREGSAHDKPALAAGIGMQQLNYQTTTHGSNVQKLDEPVPQVDGRDGRPALPGPPDGAGVCHRHLSLPAFAELLGSLRDGGAVRLVADLVDALPLPALLTDCSRQLRFVYGNAAWSSHAAGRRAACEGRPLAEVLETAGENPFLPPLWRVCETGEAVHFRGAPCVGMIGARVVMGGDVTMWDWDAHPLGGERGHPTHLLVVLRDVTERHLRRARHQPGASLNQEDLTARERDVAELIASGLRNPAIATRLHISRTTVASHVTRILQKLGFTSRAQVAVWVVEQRLSGRGSA